ncbi:MAG: hypothetical protein ACRD7E_12070 [Bryobacteraceae bacterium]
MTDGMFDVECPCCQAVLRVDSDTKTVISHKPAEKPAHVEDLTEAVAKLKGEAARREEAFQKSVAENKTRKAVLDKKFDELLKQAKSEPGSAPPKRAFDFD